MSLKKVVMSSISLILQDPRVTVNRTLLPINHLVLRWVTSGKVQNTKEIKEVVTLMSNLVKVQMKVANSAARSAQEDERGLLRLLLFLCDPAEDKSQRVNPTLRKEIFEKVERQFLIGLRSRSPSTRRAFFKLHHGTVGQSLFDRLEYIVMGQDWECLSDTFWLKQALDFLLAILVEKEPVARRVDDRLVPDHVRRLRDHVDGGLHYWMEGRGNCPRCALDDHSQGPEHSRVQACDAKRGPHELSCSIPSQQAEASQGHGQRHSG